MSIRTYTLRIPGAELEERLLPLLTGRVFHVTSPVGARGIESVGFVRSNITAEFPFTKPQSWKNYGRCHGMTCLFDLRRVSDSVLQLALQNLYFVDLIRGQNVFLFLRREAETSLKFPPISMADVNYQYVWIPNVEVYYPGDIPVDELELALHVKLCRQWTAAARVQYQRVASRLAQR